MDSQTLALVAGAVLALVGFYVPKLNEKFAALDEGTKRIIMLILLAVTSGAVFGLSCTSWAAILPAGWAVTCDEPGIQKLVQNFLLAVAVNQGVFTIAPRPAVVQKAIDLRRALKR